MYMSLGTVVLGVMGALVLTGLVHICMGVSPGTLSVGGFLYRFIRRRLPRIGAKSAG
jgi:hypothetical protein